MGFIKIFPLEQIVAVEFSAFGKGEPARCRPEFGIGKTEFFLNTDFIRSFEECPLYLVTEEDPNLLTDGIRILLSDGTTLIVQNDSSQPDHDFFQNLKQAVQQGISGEDGSRSGF